MTKRKLNALLAVIIAVAVIFAGLGILAMWTASGYYEVTDEQQLSNGTTAKTIKKYDRNGNMVATTDKLIFNENGEIVDVIEDYEGSYLIPISFEAIEDSSVIYVGNICFKKYAFFEYGLILDLPLIILYSVLLRKYKKKKYENEMKKMKLDSI